MYLLRHVSIRSKEMSGVLRWNSCYGTW